MYLGSFAQDRDQFSLNILLSLDNFNHLAALVLSAMGAGAVSANLLVAIGAFCQLRNLQTVVRPACRSAPLGM